MNPYQNPFNEDRDRREIWAMLVERDIEAFVRRDWLLLEGDFLGEGFFGLDACGRDDPDGWTLGFPTLERYREAWLAQAERMGELAEPDDIRFGLIAATVLRDIELTGESAVAHKKFRGAISLRGGGRERLQWQSLYHCRKVGGTWKIAGFVGYLPSPMGSGSPKAVKRLPQGAAQHRGAGPYSPVLRVSARELVVISGQAAISPDGAVQGSSLTEQARATLENCRRQLATAGCDFEDVFKVNVYMTDLAHWSEFNDVYERLMPDPKPVRTAVQAVLLPGLLVEVEMWAATA